VKQRGRGVWILISSVVKNKKKEKKLIQYTEVRASKDGAST